MGNSTHQKPLKELAKPQSGANNPTQLGDPVSLKAETEDSHPTEQDRGAQPATPNKVTYGPNGSSAQTPTGIGNSKVVGGASPPSTLNTPPMEGADAREEGGKKKKDGTEGEEGETKRQRLGDVAKPGNNPRMLGDPASLRSETADSEPTERDRGSLRDERKKDSKL